MKFEPREPIVCYAARTANGALLQASSSGGMFTELARQIFEDGGLVVGAGWNRETMCAEHKCASNEDELAELRGSKYTESDLSKVYKPIKDALPPDARFCSRECPVRSPPCARRLAATRT